MLSWQRISLLIRRTRGPLFFFDERELQEPIVILPLSVYESLLRAEQVKNKEGEEIRVPVRLSSSSTEKQGAEQKGIDTLAPDLKGKEEKEGISPSPFTSPSSETGSQKLDVSSIVTPPASLLDERTLEERFYFQTPPGDDYR